MRVRIRLLGLALAAGFAGASCGTVSGLELATPTVAKGRFATYRRVVIEDFAHAGAASSGAQAARDLPDLIATQLRLRGDFADVERNGSPDSESLVIRGMIHRSEAGSSTRRLLVGLGTGMSHLEATIELRDGGTDALLATIDVDKNSWPLGGAIAASQDPGDFMEQAAEKVADELHDAKSSR